MLLGCCRSNFASPDRAAPPEIPAQLDWARFVALARFHRVQGLAWNGLAPFGNPLPDHVKEMLSSDARSIAATNLGIAKECSDLLEVFRDAEVPLLFVKGLTVGALAYRSPMLKMGWDIDLLIDGRDLAKAAELLARRGYSLRLPSEPTQLRSWHARSKESVWSRDESFHIELHTRLADNRRLISGIDVHSTRQMVEVAAGIALPTLGRDELFAYLCVHGASSAWFRLKWITDLAALLSRDDPDEIERLYRRSRQLGAGRAAAQAVLLADRLYAVLDDTGLRQELERDAATRWLAALALDQVAGSPDPMEPTATPFGTWRIHLNQLAAGGGVGFALDDLWRQAADALFLRRFGSRQ